MNVFKPFKFQRNYKTAYYLLKIVDRLREHGKTVSIINKTMPKRTFKFEINDTDTAYTKIQEHQQLTNLEIISDTVEPPKPKYPTLEDYCNYCTDNNCNQCSICEQLEEQHERENQISYSNPNPIKIIIYKL